MNWDVFFFRPFLWASFWGEGSFLFWMLDVKWRELAPSNSASENETECSKETTLKFVQEIWICLPFSHKKFAGNLNYLFNYLFIKIQIRLKLDFVTNYHQNFEIQILLCRLLKLVTFRQSLSRILWIKELMNEKSSQMG